MKAATFIGVKQIECYPTEPYVGKSTLILVTTDTGPRVLHSKTIMDYIYVLKKHTHKFLKCIVSLT